MITINTLRASQVHALSNARRALNRNINCLSVLELFKHAHGESCMTSKQKFNALQQMCALGLFVRVRYNQYMLTDKGRAVALTHISTFTAQIKQKISVENGKRQEILERIRIAQKELALSESRIEFLNSELESHNV